MVHAVLHHRHIRLIAQFDHPVTSAHFRPRADAIFFYPRSRKRVHRAHVCHPRKISRVTLRDKLADYQLAGADLRMSSLCTVAIIW